VSTVILYEFQREGDDGEWTALGLARGVSEQFDVDDAVAALRATRYLERGSYRVRAVEDEQRWHFGEVDAKGNFNLLDEPRPADLP
jgi:hypothetical protein